MVLNEKTTDLPQVADKIYHIMLYRVHFALMNTDSFKYSPSRTKPDNERGEGCSHRDHMVVGFTTTCAISAYCPIRCEFESLL